VIALVERLIRDRFPGQQVGGVGSHREISYDRANKVRHGRCQAMLQSQPNVPARGKNASVVVNYRVHWLDQKTGQFQVVIDP
jgi:hypothetical protein